MKEGERIRGVAPASRRRRFSHRHAGESACRLTWPVCRASDQVRHLPTILEVHAVQVFLREPALLDSGVDQNDGIQAVFGHAEDIQTLAGAFGFRGSGLWIKDIGRPRV